MIKFVKKDYWFLCLFIVLSLAVYGQDTLIFSKKNSNKIFKFPFTAYDVRIKPIGSKAVHAIILGYKDSVLTFCIPDSTLKYQRKQLAKLFMDSTLTDEEKIAKTPYIIYSKKEELKLNKIKSIVINMDGRKQYKKLNTILYAIYGATFSVCIISVALVNPYLFAYSGSVVILEGIIFEIMLHKRIDLVKKWRIEGVAGKLNP